MNQVNLIGYLGKDWELTDSGDSLIAKNSLAITKTIKRGNDTIKHTDWMPLVSFAKRAEILNKHTHKGDRLCVTGEIHTSHYNKDGENRIGWQIIVNSFVFLSNKEDKESTDESIEEEQDKKAPQIVFENENLPTDENIPF